MSEYPQVQSDIVRPESRFAATIASRQQLQRFNDCGGMPVDFDTIGSETPHITLTGSRSKPLSLWETHSPSGFVTKPKFDGRLITIRFLTSGRIVYWRRSGVIEGLQTHATLVDFDDLLELQASGAFSAISGTFEIDGLTSAHRALTGGDEALPSFAAVAETATPGMRSLFLTLRQVRLRIQRMDRHDDLVFPLFQEVLGYQLLTAWPKRARAVRSEAAEVASCNLRAAVEYIEANLAQPLILADIAAAAGISVRSLQDKFRRKLGTTPVQFIITQRLERVHRDLSSSAKARLSIADIARHWGFVHMGDFTQRYRRLYGHTPTEARRV